MANKFFSAKAVPQGLSLQSVQKKRVSRRPTHTFNLKHRPWLLQPFMIAPVLAGETLMNLMYQARVVSDVVKSPLVGWHLEYYYYYVPLRYLSRYMSSPQVGAPGNGAFSQDGRSVIESMLLNINNYLDAATYGSASAKPALYEYDANGETTPSVAWLDMITQAVAAHHFRDEGDNPNAIDNLPVVKLAGNSWRDSVYAADEFTDYTVDVDATPTPDNWSIEEMDGLYQTYLALKAQTMTELTFEDYVQTFGVRQSIGEELAPMLLKRSSHWSYPTNTVNPSDVLDGEDQVVQAAGTPSAALSWSVNQRADKRLFVKEPGFIVGFTTARPKVYIKAQRTYAASLMADAFSWLPAVYKENVETSIKKINQDEGPLGTATFRAAKDYWFDMRDLFIYGDQFLNYAIADADGHVVNGPHASDQINAGTKYPASADLNLPFVDAANNKLKQDGVVNLNIMGTQVDHT